ncbi:MAG: hypothetical protein WEB87_02420 [Bacteriovoracaceae bacterium]
MKLVLLFLFLTMGAFAQDERYYRQIFTDELSETEEEPIDYKVIASTPEYLVDINRDNRKEKIRILKKDGLDFFQIKDRFGRTRFESKLEAKGLDSRLYKASLKTISKKTDALILYFYEGHSGTAVFQATARLYFLTIENRSLDDIYLFRGPAFFYEKENPVERYARRFYNVSVVDYNQDGRNEVSINYNKIQRTFFYLRKGLWQAL